MVATVRVTLLTPQVLFVDGECLNVHGYTSHVLRILQSNSLVVACHGSLKTLTYNEGMACRGLRHMRTWVEMCCEAVAAEFPSWDVFGAFEVFHLHDEEQQRGVTPAAGGVTPGLASPNFGRSLQRLAKVFHLDPDSLQKEYKDLRTIAEAVHRNAGCSSHASWKVAFERTQDRAEMRKKYPVSNLLRVLAAYMAWTTSSSGVEQHFSKVERSQLDRHPGGPDTERRAVIALGRGACSQANNLSLCEVARGIFVEVRPGMARQRARTRLDKGVERPSSLRQDTEVAWKRRRRAEVDEAVARTTTTPSKQARAVASPVSSEKRRRELPKDRVEKEKLKQRRLCFRRRVEAQADGLLLDDEMVAEKEVTKRAKQNQKLDERRRLKFEAQLALENVGLPSCVSPEWIWSGLGAQAWVQRSSGAVVAGLRQHGLELTQDLCLQTNTYCCTHFPHPE